MSKRAEELARGLFNCLSKDRYLTEDEHQRIVEAIVTAMQEVRRRDAEVCRAISDRSDKHDYSDYANPKEARRIHTGIHCTAGICAAAIDREPLP